MHLCAIFKSTKLSFLTIVAGCYYRAVCLGIRAAAELTAVQTSSIETRWCSRPSQVDHDNRPFQTRPEPRPLPPHCNLGIRAGTVRDIAIDAAASATRDFTAGRSTPSYQTSCDDCRKGGPTVLPPPHKWWWTLRRPTLLTLLSLRQRRLSPWTHYTLASIGVYSSQRRTPLKSNFVKCCAPLEWRMPAEYFSVSRSRRRSVERRSSTFKMHQHFLQPILQMS